MADYRCYLVNSLDQIQSATNLQCEQDSEAMLQAGAIAQAQSLTVEIWNGARLVGRVPQAGPTLEGANCRPSGASAEFP